MSLIHPAEGLCRPKGLGRTLLPQANSELHRQAQLFPLLQQTDFRPKLRHWLFWTSSLPDCSADFGLACFYSHVSQVFIINLFLYYASYGFCFSGRTLMQIPIVKYVSIYRWHQSQWKLTHLSNLKVLMAKLDQNSLSWFLDWSF